MTNSLEQNYLERHRRTRRALKLALATVILADLLALLWMGWRIHAHGVGFWQFCHQFIRYYFTEKF